MMTMKRSVDAAKRLTASLPKALKPKNDITTRLAAVVDCGSALEDLTRELVHQARAEGLSWQAIGDVFGTSRQNVQQRFGRGSDDDDGGDEGGVPALV